MNEKWMVYSKKADFNAIASHFGIDPVIARILVNRDIATIEEIEKYLEVSERPPKAPDELFALSDAADITVRKIREGRKIRIIGDYDIDGVCATSILQKGLTAAGADADYVVPHRISDGYGINISMVENAFEAGVDTIITCDNGIAAADEAARAKELGMTMIVTDHHEVPSFEDNGVRRQKLPPADVVVDPRQENEKCAYRDICGAVVALRLVEKVWELMNIAPDDADTLYELGAFATIGDIMPLTGYNRALVKWGLKSMAHTKNPGLEALINRCGLDRGRLNAYHIGFVLGPCINAGGRLDTAQKAVGLWLENDISKAAKLADELAAINADRKDLTLKGTEEGLELAKQQSEDRVLVIYLPELHESIAGLVASRIKEQEKKPTIVLTNAAQGAKGSGRSIPAYSMFDELSSCRDLFTKFGGHPMACGLSLPIENIDEFRRRINESCRLTEEDFREIIHIDAAMPFSYVTTDLIEQLEKCLEPVGNGNTKPVFACRDVEILEAKRLGAQGKTLKLTALSEDKRRHTLMVFREVESFLEYYSAKFSKQAVDNMLQGIESGIRMTVTYSPQINEYRGVKSIQFVVDHYQ